MIGCGFYRCDNFTYRLLKADFSINHAIQLIELHCLRAHLASKQVSSKLIPALSAEIRF
jgi:hypothetical protein